MPITAEQIQTTEPQHILDTPLSADVMVVSDMPQDELVKYRADKFIRSLGTIAVNQEMVLEVHEREAHDSYDSLKDAIHAAASGDQRARSVVRANVLTDKLERGWKVEQVIESELEVHEHQIHQHGQPIEKVQANSWNFATQRWQMRERVTAEIHNSFRLKESLRQGELEDGSFVVISKAADNMDDKSMQDEGFFTDTMSCSIQVVTIKNGVLTLESAFVAGVAEPGAERHDEQTIVRMGDELGIDFRGKTAADIIDTPFIIKNKHIPNGVIDLVKLYDRCAGGTFFGKNEPQGDYQAVVEVSKERALSLEQKVEEAVSELIDQAPNIKTEPQATRLLNKISGKHMVKRAVEDISINPMNFGEASAKDIIIARRHAALGNYELANAATARAIKADKSSSCPGSATYFEEESEGDAFSNTIGNPDDPVSKEWHGGKIHKNSKCRGCSKVKSEVGACYICKDCVGKPSKPKTEQKSSQTEKPKSHEISNVTSLTERRLSRQKQKQTLGQKMIKLAA